MRTVHFSDARSNLKAVMDQTIDDHDAVLITRRDAPNVVLMSEAQYESWKETMYLLQSPRNAERILRSIAQHRRGEATERQLIDPDAT